MQNKRISWIFIVDKLIYLYIVNINLRPSWTSRVYEVSSKQMINSLRCEDPADFSFQY